ncbi:hypothetical protein HELRODRAFT_168861 [Helobdella robusta]|uniref:Uncharacterized protein n=1 Tax=Helobdella robusta TaxID=6412 RepID=T1F122_HELRO|nr:hypothetical protein HELRODRAFT_168861 [Helobdella robusta]ESO08940.1 hypothetical protein HELRODRAFT_168861 [Helobdella robusta]
MPKILKSCFLARHSNSCKFSTPQRISYWIEPVYINSKLVDNANEWLRKNTQVQVMSCQTIVWSSWDPTTLDDSSQMVISKSTTEDSITYFKSGLRLWLEPRTDRNSSQTLCCVDLVPDKKHTTVNCLIDKLNQKISNKQLKGRLVTIETTSFPCSGEQKVDSKHTKWTESMNDDIQYAFVIRKIRPRSYRSLTEVPVPVRIQA